MEYISTLSQVYQVLILWIVPSLTLLLLFLQIRHFENETIPEFFRYQDNTIPILIVTIWPLGILVILFVAVVLPTSILMEKYKISFSFLVTDFKFK